MIPDHRMGDLLVFRSKRRVQQAAQAPEPRFTNRLSDQITASFYESCRIGNLEAASQLAQALEVEVERSARLAATDGRDDGDDLAAVRARLAVESDRREQEAAADKVDA